MSDDRDIVYAAAGFGFGVWSFFRGFMYLRRERLIQNIPTSTIRGMAMGLVEIKGKASTVNILISPLTKSKCVLYKFTVEEYRSSGKSGRWVTVASGDSLASPFLLDDETGKIMVFPQGAEMIWPRDYFFTTGIGKQIPNELINFLDEHGMSYRGWLGQKSMRFSEWHIQDGQMVYVLGSAQKSEGDYQGCHTEELIKRLEKLKSDSQKMKEVDTNKDGNISQEEWDTVVKNVEQELLTQAIKNSTPDNSLDVVIAKGEGKQVFIISDESEKQIVGDLSRKTLFGIFGGAVLSLATLAYLLFRLQMVWFR